MPQSYTDLQDLLSKMQQFNASDLHLASGLPPIFRINKELIELQDAETLRDADIQRMLYSIMSGEQRELFLKNLSTISLMVFLK